MKQLAWHVVSRLTEAATEVAIARTVEQPPLGQPTIVVVERREPAVLVYAVPR